jgi:predicted DNA-binding transcriptional regulator AlpA
LPGEVATRFDRPRPKEVDIHTQDAVGPVLKNELLYDENYVAQLLGCTPKALQAWRTRGGGPPFVKLGRLVRYKWSDVSAWLETRRRTSTSHGRDTIPTAAPR